MIWIIYALLAALFTSLTTILSKIGIKNVNSNIATFIRTFVVILCCIVICLITNSFSSTLSFSIKNWIYLGLSGISTGLSWLCYFKALKLADVNKVAPIDKSSFVLTSILFLIFFFNDTTNNGDALTIVMLCLSICLMLIGTFLMIEKKDVENKKIKKTWLIYSILSSVFASFVSLFIKLGLDGIPTSIGTLYRTIIVFVFAGTIILVKKDYKNNEKLSLKSLLFLILSGIATGLSWLLEYEALNYVDSNPIVVNSIGKLSILLTMGFSFFILKEKFTIKSLIGLLILTSGIILIIIFGL